MENIEVNENIKKIINKYHDIKCSICLQKLSKSNINSFFIMPRTDKGKYYCSKICYNFI